MDRITSFAALSQIASGFLNTLQDRVLAQRPASDNNDLASTNALGFEARLWVPSALSLAAFTTVQIDKNVDWRDRLVLCAYASLPGGAYYPGQTTDFDLRTGLPITWSFTLGYTGSGAYSNITTGAAVSSGNPPIAGAGAFRSYRVEPLSGASLFVWAKPGTGELSFYNNTAGAIQPLLLILATGKLGKR